MPKMGDSMGDYLKTLRQRAKDSHVYKKYQLTGLQIAEILGDQKHKALYIKLAKEGMGDRLIGIAKDVAERKEVKNKGAYFMRIVIGEKIKK